MKVMYEKAKNNKTISITIMSSLHTVKWLWQLFNASARCIGNKSSEQSRKTYLTVTQHTIYFTQTYRLKMSSMVLNKKLMAHISQYLFVVNVFLNINQCIWWWFTQLNKLAIQSAHASEPITFLPSARSSCPINTADFQ